VFFSFHNYQGSTQDVAEFLEEDTQKVGSLMVVLEHKGLLEVVEARRGVKGGSIWRVTRRAKKMYGVK
jgi:hypothetical protein